MPYQEDHVRNNLQIEGDMGQPGNQWLSTSLLVFLNPKIHKQHTDDVQIEMKKKLFFFCELTFQLNIY